MNDLLNQLTPEELHQLMGLSTAEDEKGLMDEQMARAMALRGHPVQHSTGMGGALGALGDALNAGMSGYRENQVEQNQKALMAKRLAGRNLLADILRRKPTPLPFQPQQDVQFNPDTDAGAEPQPDATGSLPTGLGGMFFTR